MVIVDGYFRVSFWTKIVLAFLIRSDIIASSTHPLIWRACLLGMCVNTFNVDLCMSFWHGVFPFGNFLTVALSDSGSISTSESSSSPCSFFHVNNPSTFLLCSFSSHILLQTCFAFFASIYWFVFVHSPPTYWFHFLPFFRKDLFWYYWLNLSQYILILSYFANVLIYLLQLYCLSPLLFSFGLFLLIYLFLLFLP